MYIANSLLASRTGSNRSFVCRQNYQRKTFFWLEYFTLLPSREGTTFQKVGENVGRRFAELSRISQLGKRHHAARCLFLCFPVVDSTAQPPLLRQPVCCFTSTAANISAMFAHLAASASRFFVCPESFSAPTSANFRWCILTTDNRCLALGHSVRHGKQKGYRGRGGLDQPSQGCDDVTPFF